MRLVDGVVDSEHGLVDQERVDGWEVPEQLLSLAHDEGDLREVLGAAVPGREAQHVHLAVGGMQQAAHDLEGGGLAGAVGSQEADDLAAVDLERDSVDGADEAVAAAHDAAQRGAQSAGAFGDDVVLDEVADGDVGGHGISLAGRCVVAMCRAARSHRAG